MILLTVYISVINTFKSSRYNIGLTQQYMVECIFRSSYVGSSNSCGNINFCVLNVYPEDASIYDTAHFSEKETNM